VSLLVVGSIALDTIETPHGKVVDILGGSATFISSCARYFVHPVRIVGIVGSDFPKEYIRYFEESRIDVEGLQIRRGEKTFRWGGKYDEHLGGRDTLFTELNAFETFDPVIPQAYRRSDYVCLGNIDPGLQLRVLDQIEDPKMVVGDTMNFWIDGKREELLKTIKRLSVFILSDSEAQMLAGTKNIVDAGDKILNMGPPVVVVKKGENGALLLTREAKFVAPAYPLGAVYDPTGAGDAFAGGFLGWIARSGDHSFENLKRAVIYGNVMASFCIEKFSVDAITHLEASDINKRIKSIYELSQFQPAYINARD
jgi:sugar/nucleoside kinase (ribokinase family)